MLLMSWLLNKNPALVQQLINERHEQTQYLCKKKSLLFIFDQNMTSILACSHVLSSFTSVLFSLGQTKQQTDFRVITSFR